MLTAISPGVILLDQEELVVQVIMMALWNATPLVSAKQELAAAQHGILVASIAAVHFARTVPTPALMALMATVIIVWVPVSKEPQ